MATGVQQQTGDACGKGEVSVRTLASIVSFLILSLTIVVVVYLYGGKQVGWAMAQIDVHRGDYRVIIAGLPDPWDQESNRIFKEKYHIKRQRIAYCIVSPWTEGYFDGYNTVSVPAIQAKYYKKVLTDAARDSIQEYMRTHKPEGNQKKYCETRLSLLENR